MDLLSYLEKIETIRKKEFISDTELCDQVGIAWTTLRRIKQQPELCSLKTMRKLKVFLDERKEKYGSD